MKITPAIFSLSLLLHYAIIHAMNNDEHKPVVPVASATDPEQATSPEARMSLGEHLSELRLRVFICLICFVAVFIAGMVFYKTLWNGIRLPVIWTAEMMGPETKPNDLVKFQWLGPVQGFVTILKIDLFCALCITMPVTVYQLWQFVSPGLTRQEKRAMIHILTAGSFLFAVGVVVAFRYAIPIGLRFLIPFNDGLDGSVNQWTGDLYIGFMIMSCVGFGVAFETPLVMMALGRVGLINSEAILRHWRGAVLAMFVLGAVFTPPDPFTQIMLAGLMIGLFFMGYWLVRMVERR